LILSPAVLLARLIAALLTLCLLGTAQAAALVPADLTKLSLRPHVQVMEDAGGKLTIADVSAPAMASRFQTVPGTSDLNFGFTSSAYWLRFQLRSDASMPSKGLLEVAYPALDRVDFYADLNGAPVALSAGYTLPFSTRPFVHRQLVFPITLAPGAETSVYLRVASRSSMTVPLSLWSPEALHASDQRTYSVAALYFGMLVALAAYNLLLFISLRDSIYLMYVAFLVSLAISQAGILGLASQFLWPDWPQAGDLIRPAGYCIASLFGAMFSRRLLLTATWAPRLDKLLGAMQAAFLVLALSALATDWQPITIFASVLGAVFSVTTLGIGLTAVKHRRPLASLYFAGSFLLLVGGTTFSLRVLGWVPTNALTSNSLFIGSFFEMLLLSLSMAQRIHGLRQETSQAQRQALQARLETIDTMLQSEKMLEQRIAARTAELAQANALLQHSQTALTVLAHHDALTGLANRARLHDQLRQAVARSQRDGGLLAVLMIDLDGFKPINDRYGHAAGDLLLQAIAQRIVGSVRTTDTVARLGGDEFVVLLEGVKDLDHARAIADKLVQHISQPCHFDAATVQVGASVGIALCPDQADDIDRLLLLADQDMYRAKALRHGRQATTTRDGLVHP
jgi:diguanylate cyclase (GGDEF)-like protein